jgi:hypothetical protein
MPNCSFFWSDATIFIDIENNDKGCIAKDTNGIQSNYTPEYVYSALNFETALFEKL